MLLLCSQPPLLAVAGCKFVNESRGGPLFVISLSLAQATLCMLCGCVLIRGDSWFLCYFCKKQKSHYKGGTLTPAVCHSSYSRRLLRHPRPRWGQGTRRGSSTSCVRTRSRRPRPAWGRAARPPNTSRWRQPESKSGGFQRWWSTPAEGATHNTRIRLC